MRFAKCVTLTILCLTVIEVYGQTQTAACVQKLCSSIDAAEPLAQFLADGKTTHPELENFFKPYEAKIDKVRTARYQAMKSAISAFQDGQKVKQSVLNLSDIDFLSFLLDFSLWNVKTVSENGQLQLAADPIVSSDKSAQITAINSLFKIFLKVSPLYRTNLQVNQFNGNPRQILGLSPKQALDSLS